MQQVDLALLVLRVVFGVFLACHGINKVKGGLAGTARWFGGIGMKWPKWQARIAASTEIGAGLLFALGLLTGNYPATGRLKVKHAGLDPDLFQVNAFAMDGTTRRDLPPVALRRYRERHGSDG